MFQRRWQFRSLCWISSRSFLVATSSDDWFSSRVWKWLWPEFVLWIAYRRLSLRLSNAWAESLHSDRRTSFSCFNKSALDARSCPETAAKLSLRPSISIFNPSLAYFTKLMYVKATSSSCLACCVSYLAFSISTACMLIAESLSYS
jgi:hypothetical protein